MKTLFTWILAAVVMVLLVIHETGILEEHFGPGAPAGTRLLAAPAPTGEFVALERHELGIVAWASGRLEAKREVDVYPELGGRVLDIDAPIGAHIARGDVLANLDPEAANLAVERASAALALAKSRVDAASAATAASDTAILAAEVQRELASIEAARQTELQAKSATTDQAFQAAKSTEKAAVAQVASARAHKAQAEAETARALESVRLAEVDLRDAERVATKTAVLAPVDGIVLARHSEAGSFASLGMALVTLAASGALDAVAYFPEERLPGLGDELFVRVGTLELGRVAVTELGATVEPFTRTRAVRVSLEARADELASFAPGSFVELGQRTGTRSLLLVPARAVRRQGQVQSVRIETERGPVQQHVRAVPLTAAEASELGRSGDTWLAVRSGLRDDDRVEVGS